MYKDDEGELKVGLFLGLVIASVAWGATLAAAMATAKNDFNQKVFQEQIDRHGCKVVEYYDQGVKTMGDICVMPDGTVIRKR